MSSCSGRSFFFQGDGGVNIYTRVWAPDTQKPKAVIQIAHGMRESTAYYNEFAQKLASDGFFVYINDARGHGMTAGMPESAEFHKNAGYMGDDGINAMVGDLISLTGIIKREHAGLPVFLLGHSMGSVLSRLYILKKPEDIDGLIVSGTTGPVNSYRLEKMIESAENEAKKYGRRAEAIQPPELLCGHFNDRFRPLKTPYDYMSRDQRMVEDAVSSPFAKIIYSTGFYVDFFKALAFLNDIQNLELLSKTLPIFSVSGSDDPFGDCGNGVRELFQMYESLHVEDAKYIIYPGGRHEMLRETNREEVFSDIIGWIENHLRQ